MALGDTETLDEVVLLLKGQADLNIGIVEQLEKLADRVERLEARLDVLFAAVTVGD